MPDTGARSQSMLGPVLTPWRDLWRGGDDLPFGNQIAQRAAVILFTAGTLWIAVVAAWPVASAQWGVNLLLGGGILLPFTRLRAHLPAVTWPLLAFAVVIGLSALVNGLWWHEAQWAIHRLWRLTLLPLLLLCPAVTRRARGPALAVFALIAVLGAGIAWGEAKFGAEFLQFLHAGERTFTVKSDGTVRAQGLFNHTLTYAEFAAMVAPFLLALAVHARAWRPTARILLGVAGLVALSSLLATHGRAAYLGAAGALFVLACTLPHRWLWRGVTVAGIGVAGVLVLLPGATQRAATVAGNRFQAVLPRINLADVEGRVGDYPGGRLVLTEFEVDRPSRWYFGTKVVRDYPVLGVGQSVRRERYWQAFLARGQAWKWRNGIDFWEGYHVHNTYLQTAIEVGLVGLSAFFLIWLTVLRGLAVRAGEGLRTQNPSALAFPVAAGCLLVSAAIVGLFDHNFHDTEIQIPLWLLLAFALMPECAENAHYPVRAHPWPASGALAPLWIATVALAAMAGTIFIRKTSAYALPGLGDVSRVTLAVVLAAGAGIGLLCTWLAARRLRGPSPPPTAPSPAATTPCTSSEYASRP